MADQTTASRVTVGLSSCGIAAGAAHVFDEFRTEFESKGLGVLLKRTGCIGMCYREPLVDVDVRERAA